jgi:ubiquinone/menaquinone biosynthesis C-methylase UbiE
MYYNFVKEILKKSYDKSASIYDKNFRDHQFLKYKLLLEDHISVINKSENVCDLGCGTGLLAEYLTSKGITIKNMTGVDFSDEMLFYAKKRQIKCINSDISRLPFNENTFDIIFSFTVFRIIETDLNEECEILLNISKILKPEGFFFISILAEKKDDMWYSMLKNNGFIIVKEIRCGQDQGFVLINKKK